MLKVFDYIYNIIFIPFFYSLQKINNKKNISKFKFLQSHSIDTHYNNQRQNYFLKNKSIIILILFNKDTGLELYNSINNFFKNNKFFKVINISHEIESADLFLLQHSKLIEIKNIIDMINPDLILNLSYKINYNFFSVLRKYEKKIISIINYENKKRFKKIFNYFLLKTFSTDVLDEEITDNIENKLTKYLIWNYQIELQ